MKLIPLFTAIASILLLSVDALETKQKNNLRQVVIDSETLDSVEPINSNIEHDFSSRRKLSFWSFFTSESLL